MQCVELISLKPVTKISCPTLQLSRFLLINLVCSFVLMKNQEWIKWWSFYYQCYEILPVFCLFQWHAKKDMEYEKGNFFCFFMWSHTSSPYCIQLFFYKSYFMQAFRHYNYPLALDYHQCLEYELYIHIIIQMKRFVRNHLKFPIMQQESKYSH